MMTDNKKHIKDETRRDAIFCFVFFILSIGCILFSDLIIWQRSSVNGRKEVIWTSLVSVLLILGYIFFHFFLYKGSDRVSKLIFSFYLILFVCLCIAYILQSTGFFVVVRDEDLLQEYLKKSGRWMPTLYVLLQFLQVVVLPIPSIVSTVAGIALFGAVKTLLYSFIGITIGSFVAFFIGRKLGNRVVSWMIGEENLKKWQDRLKGRDNLFLTAMFILPLFPDDILCFFAGLSSMTWRYFAVMMMSSRLIALSATCFSIDLIPFNTWWGILIWCLFGITILVSCLFLHKNKQKICKKIALYKRKRKERK